MYPTILSTRELMALSGDTQKFYEYSRLIAKWKYIAYRECKHDLSYIHDYQTLYYAFEECRKYNKEVAERAALSAQAGGHSIATCRGTWMCGKAQFVLKL